MAHPQQFDFVERVKKIYPEYFKEKVVVEFGSLNLNGTVRILFENCIYTGVDIVEGEGVDVISMCQFYYPNEKPDVVISCEMLEHDESWRASLQQMFFILKSKGLLIFTCATAGRKEHGTSEHSPADSPATNDYYKNLTMADISNCFYDYLAANMFDVLHLETNDESYDLYLYAIKK